MRIVAVPSKPLPHHCLFEQRPSYQGNGWLERDHGGRAHFLGKENIEHAVCHEPSRCRGLAQPPALSFVGACDAAERLQRVPPHARITPRKGEIAYACRQHYSIRRSSWLAGAKRCSTAATFRSRTSSPVMPL